MNESYISGDDTPDIEDGMSSRSRFIAFLEGQADEEDDNN
jgi:hypothetical protein